MSYQLINYCSRNLAKAIPLKYCRNFSTVFNHKSAQFFEHDRTKLPFTSSSKLLSCRLLSNKYIGNRRRSRPTDTDNAISTKRKPKIVEIPEYWPQVPVVATNQCVFPYFAKHIEITDARLIDLIRQKIALKQPYVGLFLRRNRENNSELVKSMADVHQIGTFCYVSLDDDNGDKLKLTVSAVRRIRMTNQLFQDDFRLPPWAPPEYRVPKSQLAGDEPLLMAEIDNVNHKSFEQTTKIRAISKEIVKTIRGLIAKNPVTSEILEKLLHHNQNVVSNTVYLCDLGAALTSAEADKLQKVMEERNIEERLLLTLSLLKEDMEMSRLQERITKEVEDKVKRIHKKFMLNEQIKILKKELGIDVDDKDVIIERFRQQLVGKKVPKAVTETIEDEIKKLKLIEGYGADFNVVRNYVEWLTAMPWGTHTKENQDLDKAAQLLDANHFGMQDVKTRILEFIAVNTLKGSSQGKILCFHGPPGVGKTSIARSIADSLNRQYYRFSVGGMSNVAEIKGHRRTYVGAMPGKLVQCLRTTKTENPLVLIDEIDKIGKGVEQGSGDPSSAMLELLDPEQNANFMDYYLDVPVDLSNVLFICTANITDTIPGPLLDRMELIEMSGYVEEEKRAIAKQYLIPRARTDSGLTEKNVEFEDSSLATLMKSYCRESGVRDLEKMIEKITRKIAFQVVKKQNDRVVVTDKNLSTFVGRPLHANDRLYDVTPAGVVMGLGYTKLGGTVLFIETSKQYSPKSAGPDGLQLTGNLGNVMRESAAIALSVAKNHLEKLNADESVLNRSRIHLHVPLGSQPKDGPSAGVTIVAALMSLALGRPIRQNTAMTGEITLNGKILPVGGIKEKVIAAKRSGVTCLLLPEENRSDFSELPKYITDGLEVHFVSNYDQVYDVIFAENEQETELPKYGQVEAFDDDNDNQKQPSID